MRFHAGAKDNDVKMMEDMYGWMEQILRACDAEILPHRKYVEPMGDATHECGAARMGTDPKTSVLNPYCESHDVKNLFVADAAPFLGNPDKNVTLSIVALAWRTAEYMAEEMRKGNV